MDYKKCLQVVGYALLPLACVITFIFLAISPSQMKILVPLVLNISTDRYNNLPIHSEALKTLPKLTEWNSPEPAIIAKYRWKHSIYPNTENVTVNPSCLTFRVWGSCIPCGAPICVECWTGENCTIFESTTHYILQKNISECNEEWSFLHLQNNCLCQSYHRRFIFVY